MDEFNAAMAGLDAGIAESSPSPGSSACACPAGQCVCANHQQQPSNGSQQNGDGYWDRPRCGFAVSTERGGCCASPGMVSDVGSEIGIGVGSDAGLGVGSDAGLDAGLGVGSDAGIGSDAGSVAGVGATNLSMDFADLGFGGLELPPMQYDQRFSGEYVYTGEGYRDSGGCRLGIARGSGSVGMGGWSRPLPSLNVLVWACLAATFPAAITLRLLY